MADITAMPPVDQSIGELLRQSQLFVQLPEGQQTRVAGNLGRRGLDNDGLGTEKIE
jgi:hypothetical protein